MKINIIEDYYLTSDAYNFVLNKETEVQEGEHKGEKTLVAIGFFPTILQALESLVDVKMRASTTRTLKGLIKEYMELTGQLCNTYKSLRTQVKESNG